MLTVAVIVLVAASAAHAATPQLSDQVIGRMIRAAFPDDPITAECIASSESTGTHRPPWHFDVAAENAGQYSLYQIAADWHPSYDVSRRYDVAYNIHYARGLYLNAKARWGWRYRWSGPNGTLWTTAAGCGA